MSEKQRANYYEWNGFGIKARGKKIPMSFYKDKSDVPLITTIEHLKPKFSIGCVKNQKVIATFVDSSLLPTQILTDVKYYLCEIVNGKSTPVIANPKKVGKPKHYLIKGQDIYSGNLREHFKGMVMDSIKKSYYPYVENMPVIDCYPIKITCYLHETIKNVYDKSKDLGQRWDVDNYVYPYLKAFPDLLTYLKKIKDDDRLYFPSSIPAYFVPIENHEDRKFVFVIEADERPEIKNNKIYQEYHSDFNAGFHRNKITGETEDSDLTNLKFDEEPKNEYGFEDQ